MNSCNLNRTAIQVSYHKGFIQHHDLIKSSTAYCYCVDDTLYFQVMYSEKLSCMYISFVHNIMVLSNYIQQSYNCI